MSAPLSSPSSSPAPLPPRIGLVARLIALSASRPFLTILFVAAVTAWGAVSLERAPLDAMGKVGAFTDLPPLPLARAHSHLTPLFKGHFYSVGGSKNHVPQAEVFVGTLQ